MGERTPQRTIQRTDDENHDSKNPEEDVDSSEVDTRTSPSKLAHLEFCWKYKYCSVSYQTYSALDKPNRQRGFLNADWSVESKYSPNENNTDGPIEGAESGLQMVD